MSNVDAFNTTLVEYIDFIKGVHPELPNLNGTIGMVKSAIRLTPLVPYQQFMNSVSMYGNEIFSENSEFMTKHTSTIYLIQDFNIDKMWESMASDTKNLHWQYLKSLFVLGSLNIDDSPQMRKMLKCAMEKK